MGRRRRRRAFECRGGVGCAATGKETAEDEVHRGGGTFVEREGQGCQCRVGVVVYVSEAGEEAGGAVGSCELARRKLI